MVRQRPGPLSVPGDTLAQGAFRGKTVMLVTPSAALVWHSSSISPCGLYFGLMIWVNESVLLTDGSLLGVPAKSGFRTSKAGGQRLGKAPR